MHNEWLSCYPNPVNDFLVVKYSRNITEDAEIKISDVDGKVIQLQTTSQSQSGNEIHLDLKKLSKGVYFVSISFGKERFISKFVKQ